MEMNTYMGADIEDIMCYRTEKEENSVEREQGHSIGQTQKTI